MGIKGLGPLGLMVQTEHTHPYQRKSLSDAVSTSDSENVPDEDSKTCSDRTRRKSRGGIYFPRPQVCTRCRCRLVPADPDADTGANLGADPEGDLGPADPGADTGVDPMADPGADREPWSSQRIPGVGSWGICSTSGGG